MKTNTATSLRRWSPALILALGVNLAFWALAGIAFSAEGVRQSAGAGLDGYGLLQWKVS
jgi:hypothetical protein